MIITMPVPLRSLATESKDGLMSTEDKVKLDSIEEGAQVNVQSDLSQTDETAPDYVKGVIRQESLPEGYPYEEVNVTDISGQEYEITGFTVTSLSVTHNLNIPFELGQVWSAGLETLSYECEVQAADDGTLYIGSIGASSTPFYITANDGEVLQAYMNNHRNASAFYLQCVSGTVTETTIHPMDEKFLPSSATVQSDWSVNDENNPAYVKNRTHWEEVRSISMKETSTDINWGVHFGNDKLAELLRKYKETSLIYLGTSDPIPYVYLDGTYTEGSDYCEYKVQWKSVDSGGAQLTIRIDNDGSIIVGYGVTHNNFNSATIEIIGEETIVHTIDPKYIKDMYHEESSEVFNIENAEFVDGRYINETPFVITDGNTYIVNWDGTEYICVAYTFEGIPAIGNTSDFGGKGKGEPFAIGYDSVENINFISVFDDSTEGSTVTHTFSVAEIVAHTIDHKYIKDMYYDNGSTTTVLVDNQTVTGFEVREDPIYAVKNPFSFAPTVGAIYTVTWDGTVYECTASVADGLTYIGNVNYLFMESGGDVPFVIVFDANISLATESTEESHTISITEVVHDMKQLDEKYLPILEEKNKEIFSMYNISSGEYETDTVLSVGTYNVIVDDTVMKTDFINDGAIVGQNDLCFIASFDGGIFFGFSDDEPHSVKIEIPQNVVKEEYLPESVTATPNWNAAEGENGYIENRTHYEDGNCILKFTAVNNGSSYSYNFGSYAALESYRDLVQSEDTPIYVKMNDTVLETKHSFYNGYYNLYYGENNTLIQNYIGGVNSGTLTIFPKNVDPDYSADTVDICILTTSYYELKQIDEKFLPDSVKGTPDWNQGDETSPDYIKNRTHYEINDITKLEFDITGISFSNNTQTHNLNIPFALGQIWNVYCDNRYKRDDLEVMEDEDGSLYIALLGVSGDGTWECYRITANECTVHKDFIRANYVDALHITGVSGEVSAVHKLDEKFIPVAEDDEILEMLMEQDMLLAVTDSDGSILSDENDNILLW